MGVFTLFIRPKSFLKDRSCHEQNVQKKALSIFYKILRFWTDRNQAKFNHRPQSQGSVDSVHNPRSTLIPSPQIIVSETQFAEGGSGRKHLMGSLVTDDGSVIGGSALPNKFGE